VNAQRSAVRSIVWLDAARGIGIRLCTDNFNAETHKRGINSMRRLKMNSDVRGHTLPTWLVLEDQSQDRILVIKAVQVNSVDVVEAQRNKSVVSEVGGSCLSGFKHLNLRCENRANPTVPIGTDVAAP
jgi:hypothetical protein